MSAIRQLGHQMFASLKIRNYRLYFIGQALSNAGTWMQIVALSWLVLQLTGSGVALGTVLAFRFLPMLLAGPFAGIVVDKFNKRHILYATQTSLALLALALSILVYTGTIQIWMLYTLALVIGIVATIDNPTRQTLVHEMVGRNNVRNAVALNSTNANVARAIGPLIAGSLIATVGIAFCFAANAVSFCAVLFMLSRIRPSELHHEEKESVPITNVLASISYAASVPLIRNILLSMLAIGMLTYEFQVSLSLLAQNTFNGTAADYASLLSAMGAGSVAGGLYSASRQTITLREFVLAALLFGVAICFTAIMPTLSLAIIGMIFVGFFSVNVTSLGSTMIQLESLASMRGRIMSLWSTVIFGSTVIGAPVIGFIGEVANARWALAVGGATAILAAAYTALSMRKREEPQIIEAEVEIATSAEEAKDAAAV
ncbi:MFS transporter [Candidatus Kaiserbacteria bacterium CG10_big_fil_rev_8_21_14_0_10_51_14]|uniref:MFS transporter n=1 Tax=Candidatus Kaiserbacteria bacterium CG10_big_fil_rev_8_21_14_0_10_51_14 TaxID=1974610 RepID=A0A2H0UB56_9BACT|nr:MAG: MFS transporter [Candidatus Kaiserbacteria bacterium CG10_big_fil_rev_8_21_14_0_10_51_14]